MLNLITHLKNKSADKVVLLFLKVMQSVVKSWHRRSETQKPDDNQNADLSRNAALMLAIDVLLALTQLLLSQAQQHYTDLEQLNK